MMLLWLLACGPRWSEADAVTPTLARLDTDGDGSVRESEYEAVRYLGKSFVEVDTDGNGAFSADELLTLVSETDPVDIGRGRKAPPARGKGKRNRGASQKGGGGPAQKAGGTPKGGGGPAAARPVESPQLLAQAQFVVRRVLESLQEEVRAVAPDAPLPDDEAVKRAAGSADIRTAESREVLLQLEAAADAAGIGFPAALRAAALATVPVTESFVPPDPGPDAQGPGGAPTGPRRPGGRPSGSPAPAGRSAGSP